MFDGSVLLEQMHIVLKARQSVANLGHDFNNLFITLVISAGYLQRLVGELTLSPPRRC